MTLHLMQGLPAAGKTTLARRIIAASQRPVRYVSLDALRWMLDGQRPSPHWPPGTEAATERAQAALAAQLLADGHDVLIDGTHLYPQQLHALRAALAGTAPDVLVHTLRTPVSVCTARDRRRPHPIGEACIRRLDASRSAATAAGWRLSGTWLTSTKEE